MVQLALLSWSSLHRCIARFSIGLMCKRKSRSSMSPFPHCDHWKNPSWVYKGKETLENCHKDRRAHLPHIISFMTKENVNQPTSSASSIGQALNKLLQNRLCPCPQNGHCLPQDLNHLRLSQNYWRLRKILTPSSATALSRHPLRRILKIFSRYFCTRTYHHQRRKKLSKVRKLLEATNTLIYGLALPQPNIVPSELLFHHISFLYFGV